MNHPLYYARDTGGMCNRLFPFAHLLALSQETQRPLCNPTFGHLADYFVGTHPDHREQLRSVLGAETLLPRLSMWAWQLRFKAARRFAGSTTCVQFHDELVDLEQLEESGRLEKVRWISALYTIHNPAFQKHTAVIREFFRPIPTIAMEVGQHIVKARANIDVLVGVHIRHGDYATHSRGLMYFDVSEFRQLMDRMAAQLPEKRVGFLVCSNDSQPAEAFNGLTWTSGPGTEIGDLMALAECDYIIGPASTYSEWASFYGQVPRFVHNRKNEEHYGLPTTRLTLDRFGIHQLGFGKHKP